MSTRTHQGFKWCTAARESVSARQREVLNGPRTMHKHMRPNDQPPLAQQKAYPRPHSHVLASWYVTDCASSRLQPELRRGKSLRFCATPTVRQPLRALHQRCVGSDSVPHRDATTHCAKQCARFVSVQTHTCRTRPDERERSARRCLFFAPKGKFCLVRRKRT